MLMICFSPKKKFGWKGVTDIGAEEFFFLWGIFYSLVFFP